MAQAAKFLVKIFSPDRSTPRMVLNDKTMLNIPNIVREVNKPASDVTLELAISCDDAAYTQTYGLNPYDLIEIYAKTTTYPNGYKVFTGNIQELKVRYGAQENRVSIRAFPVEAEFTFYFWINTYMSNVDTADVFDDAVDAVNGIYSPQMTKNIATTGQVHQPGYSGYVIAGLNSEMENLNASWYWRVRPDLQLDLQQYPDNAATHTLTVGKDVDMVQNTKSLIDVVNYVSIDFFDGITNHNTIYQNAASVAAYGKRNYYESLGTSSQGQSDLIGNNLIENKGDLFTKTQLVVNAQYPIETILPGDTVKVLNLTAAQEAWLSGILRVVRVRYDGATAVLDLSIITDNYGVELGKLISG